MGLTKTLYKSGETMQLDGQTLAHIEVLQNSLGETDGTLYKLMNRCITPYGKLEAPRV